MIERLTHQLVQDGISTITLYAEPQVSFIGDEGGGKGGGRGENSGATWSQGGGRL
jgi:hypothetical protein